MSKDYQRPLSIDYSILAAAQQFYGEQGFLETPVPWVIGSEAYEETKPENAIAYRTLGGFLVASAEQSFLQLMTQGQKLGKAQATTPCFRDEDHDDIHSPYFMKTELIITNDVSRDQLEYLVLVAQTFLQRYVETRIEAFDDGTFDIVEDSSGLELGSYGIRNHGNLSWIYGTGVALPRLSFAMELASKV